MMKRRMYYRFLNKSILKMAFSRTLRNFFVNHLKYKNNNHKDQKNFLKYNRKQFSTL
jgi:hypothetical protein